MKIQSLDLEKTNCLHNEKATGYVAGGPHIPSNKVNTIRHVPAKRLEPTDEHDSLTKYLFRKTYTKNCHMRLFLLYLKLKSGGI